MKKLTVAMAMAIALSGCANIGNDIGNTLGSTFGSIFGGPGPETAPLSAELAPLSQPSAGELRSFTTTSLIDGSRNTFDIRPYGYGIRARQDNGCVWTRAADWFSPSDSWANCGTSQNWHTAQARVTQQDSLYPLTVGSEGRYRRVAVSHTGRDQDRRTVCRVTGAEDVVRPGFPDTSAYVVECDDTRRVRTTWYAPGQGPVAFTQVSNSGELEEAWIRTN